MSTLTRRTGMAAEEQAAELLRQAGFEILTRNYRCRMGELDIVARRRGLLVIAEVRHRSRRDFGDAADSITAAKRRRLQLAARHLLARRPELSRLAGRFDAVLLGAPGAPIEWIEDAFRA
jgi:putative endonuclease